MDLERAILKEILNKGVVSGFSNTPVAVLKPNQEKNNFDIVQMEWGIIPGNVPNRADAEIFKRKYTTLNAKCENLLKNEAGRPSMFSNAARQRRCLMLSTGFFEWRHIQKYHAKTGEPLKSSDKYPYYINVKDQEYFFMAGIWQPWTDKETGEYSETVAVITTVANPLMMQVHNSKKRMPTILTEELAWRWMMEDLSDEEILTIAATQFPAKQMNACTVAKEFLASLEPSEPFDYLELPALVLEG